MVDWDKTFYDRRKSAGDPVGGRERRQFADSHADLSPVESLWAERPETREFARAVDVYKMSHTRKFVTLGEIYDILISLGYHK